MKQCPIHAGTAQPQCALTNGHEGDHCFPAPGEDASDVIRYRAQKDRATRLERGDHPDPNASPQEQFEHCERLGTRLLARAIELAPTLGIDPQEVGKPKDETAQLRALVAALMPVYEAAFVWSGESSTPTDCLGERTVQPSCNHNQYAGAIIHAPECNEYKANIALRDAIEQNRHRVTAALAGVAVDEEKERMRAVVEAAGAWRDDNATSSSWNRPSASDSMLMNVVDAYRRGAR